MAQCGKNNEKQYIFDFIDFWSMYFIIYVHNSVIRKMMAWQIVTVRRKYAWILEEIDEKE